jgi:preprotein translocase subunit SecG
MFTLLVILIILICVLLSLVVLAQSSKGDGLAGGLAAPGSVGAVFGVRRASDFLQKATIWLAGLFMLLALLANLFFLPRTTSGPSAIQGGETPAVNQGPARLPQSAPAVQNPPAGGQPGTGVTNPEQGAPQQPR